MTPEEIIKQIHDTDPWVSDSEYGVYCFYCDCEYQDSFRGGIFKHEKCCVWLEIEKVVDKRD